VDGHIEVDIDIPWRRKDWVLLLLDRLKLTDDAPQPGFDITGDHLEIDRDAGRAAHHGWPPEKADARKPPENPRNPAVDSASESLTAVSLAAESIGSLRIWRSQMCGLGAGSVVAHRAGPATLFQCDDHHSI
jgi:hypothetical protein